MATTKTKLIVLCVAITHLLAMYIAEYVLLAESTATYAFIGWVSGSAVTIAVVHDGKTL